MNARWLAPLLFTTWLNTTHAEPVLPQARADDVLYEVRVGDTLSGISQGYMGDGGAWRFLARLNRLHAPQLLKPGRLVRIPGSSVQTASASATLVAISGQVKGQRVGEALGPFAVGNAVQDGDRLELGPMSFATLSMPDGGTVHLQGPALMRVRSLRSVNATGAQRAVLELEQGRVEVDVPKSGPGGRFDVLTPLAVAGVRGTRFGITSREGHVAALDVVRGTVAINRSEAVRDEVHVKGGTGVVVRPGAAPLTVQSLMPAPDLASVRSVYERSTFEVVLPRLAGATTLRLQLARDAELHDILFEREDLQGREMTSLVLPAMDDGVYFLGVRGVDADGLSGLLATTKFEVRARPEPPLQQYPRDQGELLLGDASLICAEIHGAHAYHFLVVPVGSQQPIQGGQVQEHCRLTLPTSLSPGDYDWQVATITRIDGSDALRRGPLSDSRRFRLVKRPEAAAPSMSAQGQSVDLSWPQMVGLRYEVQLAPEDTFGERTHTLAVPESSKLRLAVDGCTAQFVRWRAVTERGWASDWSASQRLSVTPTVCTTDNRPWRASDNVVIQSP